MMKIKQIWEELENDKSFDIGLLIRRYSGEILADIFIALKQPEKVYCLATSISTNIEINIASFANLQEIQVEVVSDRNFIGKKLLIFKLINNQHKDIFSILCEDLILSVGNITDELKLVRQLLNRFEKWKSLFSKIGLNGLSPEEQRGLYGELYFLRKFLNHNNDFGKVLNTWVGTSNEIRDFQLNSWALEVKTTIGNYHQKIKISSERQLDISHLEFLYLYHLSLEKAQEGGESLHQIVFSIRQMLQIDVISLNKFNAKLFEAGFFEHHFELYKNIGYHLRHESFYLVNGNFPRIQENDLREGVGDVKYSIIVSNCQEYIQSEIQVLEKISN